MVTRFLRLRAPTDVHGYIYATDIDVIVLSSGLQNLFSYNSSQSGLTWVT